MIRKIFYIAIFCLITSVAFGAATPYYVTQSGAGTYDGKSIGNAWSVANFNDSGKWDSSDNADKIDPGDTVYFSGTITTTITAQGSGSVAGDITLDGYAAGDCSPVVDGHCNAGALIDRSSAAYNGIQIDNSHGYFVIQDFRVTDSNVGIHMGPGANHVLVRRNYIYENRGRGIKSVDDEGVGSGRLQYIIIGGSSGQGNYLYNNGLDGDGQGQYMGYNADNVLFSYNKVVLDSGSYGPEGITFHTCTDSLAELNTITNYAGSWWEPAIGVKGNWSAAQNVILRFNYIKNNQTSSAIDTNNYMDKIYIYANWIENAYNGIEVNVQQRTNGDPLPITDVYIWANVILHSNWAGIRTVYSSSGSLTGLYVYNNTIVNNGQSSDSATHAGFTRETGTSIYVKNNLFKNNVNNTTDQDIYAAVGTLTNDRNHGDTTLDIGGGESAGGDSTTGDADLDAVYAPNAGSGIIDTGVDLTQEFQVNLSNGDSWFETKTGYSLITMNLDTGLDINETDFTTIPPTVETLKQGDYGLWDKGAYVYGGPAIFNEYPTSQQACGFGTFGVTSVENSTCRFSVKGVDTCATVCADLDEEFQNTGARTAHTDTDEAFACDSETTLVVICVEDATSLPSNCLEIIVDVAAAGGSTPQPAPGTVTTGGTVLVDTCDNCGISMY